MSTGNKVFSVPIFFIAFRESLECALVVGLLTSMLESLVKESTPAADDSNTSTVVDGVESSAELEKKERDVLIRRLRRIVLLGAASGLFIAFCIGAAFLAVFYTQTTDLYGRSEELWEGIFNLVAVLLITPMSLAILRADRSRAKWRRKLHNAFGSSLGTAATGKEENTEEITTSKGNVLLRAKNSVRDSFTGLFSSKGAATIFIIPFITTLREGLEGVVFIGGVSLGLPATSIPLPAIVGLLVGFACGVLLWKGGSFTQIRFFLILSTCFLLIIAAGMASRAIYFLQFYGYIQLVGGAAAESGSGPGSYDSQSYIAHFDYGNPENNAGGSGWGLLNSLVGWNNTWTYGSTITYCFYWIFIMGYLTYALWAEGRLGLAYTRKGKQTILWESAKRRERRLRAESKASSDGGSQLDTPADEKKLPSEATPVANYA